MSKKAQRLTSVKTGDRIVWPDKTHSPIEVKPPCEHKNDGHWFCVTHSEGFQNQFQKDIHIHTGKHQLAWVCHHHGPEQP